MKKRILSIVLVIAMIVCMIPTGMVTVFAESQQIGGTDESLDTYQADKIDEIENYIAENVPDDLAASDDFKSQIADYKQSITDADTKEKVDEIVTAAKKYINEAIEEYFDNYKTKQLSEIGNYIADNVPFGLQASGDFWNSIDNYKNSISNAQTKKEIDNIVDDAKSYIDNAVGTYYNDYRESKRKEIYIYATEKNIPDYVTKSEYYEKTYGGYITAISNAGTIEGIDNIVRQAKAYLDNAVKIYYIQDIDEYIAKNVPAGLAASDEFQSQIAIHKDSINNAYTTEDIEMEAANTKKDIDKAIQGYYDNYGKTKITEIEEYIKNNAPDDVMNNEDFKNAIEGYKKSIEGTKKTEEIDEIVKEAMSYIDNAIFEEYKKQAKQAIDDYIAENIPADYPIPEYFNSQIEEFKERIQNAQPTDDIDGIVNEAKTAVDEIAFRVYKDETIKEINAYITEKGIPEAIVLSEAFQNEIDKYKSAINNQTLDTKDKVDEIVKEAKRFIDRDPFVFYKEEAAKAIDDYISEKKLSSDILGSGPFMKAIEDYKYAIYDVETTEEKAAEAINKIDSIVADAKRYVDGAPLQFYKEQAKIRYIDNHITEQKAPDAVKNDEDFKNTIEEYKQYIEEAETTKEVDEIAAAAMSYIDNVILDYYKSKALSDVNDYIREKNLPVYVTESEYYQNEIDYYMSSVNEAKSTEEIGDVVRQAKDYLDKAVEDYVMNYKADIFNEITLYIGLKVPGDLANSYDFQNAIGDFKYSIGDAQTKEKIDEIVAEAKEYIDIEVDRYYIAYAVSKITEIEDYIRDNVPADLASSDDFKSKIADYKQSISDADTTEKIDKIFNEAISYIIKAVESLAYDITNATEEKDKDTNNGYITIDKTSAYKDETVTVTVVPNENYKLKSLVWNDGTSDTTITATEGGVYSFTMPAKDVTVTAKFSKKHIHTVGNSDIVFDAWESNNSLPTESGNYYLTEDVTLSGAWTPPADTEINLCLNGHMIIQTESGTKCIDLSNTNSTFSLHDCNGDECVHEGYVDRTGRWNLGTGTEETDTKKDIVGGVVVNGSSSATNAAGVYVSAGNTFNMYGGTIAGCMNSGVFCTGEGSTFNMYDGTITGNKAQNGGGVYCTGSGTKFTMTTGTISGNEANEGGGVYCADGAAFEMDGGKITDNTAENGGGVNCTGSETKFTMTNGTISGNKAVNGGGVYCAIGAAFEMNGGEISYNTVTGNGGGICESGKVTVTIFGGTIKNCSAGQWGGAIQTAADSTTTIANALIFECFTTAPATERSGGGGINANGTLNINKSKILNCSTNGFGGGIRASKTTVNLTDVDIKNCSALGDDAENNPGYSGGGIFLDGATATLYGCSVMNNYAANKGGGIVVADMDTTKGSLTLLNSEVKDNTASDAAGVACINTGANTIGGSTVIDQNTTKSRKASNLCIESTNPVNLNNPTNDMMVGVTLDTGTGVFSTKASDFTTNFKSDNSPMKVVYENGVHALVCSITNATEEKDKDTNNGYITIDKTSAYKDETVTVTVVPNEGYKLKSLVWNDGEDHDITIAKSFEMPASDVTVTATFELKPADYSAVDAAIENIPADLTKYTDSSVAALNNAKDTVVRNLTADKQADVNAMAKAINDAIDGLKIKADTTALAAAVTAATAADEFDYAADIWAQIQTDVANAAKYIGKDLAADDVQSDIDALTFEINSLLEQKLEPADYTALNAAIAKAEALNKDYYTKETYDALKVTLAAAQAVPTGLNLNGQAMIDAATGALNSVIDALVLLKADYTKLEAAIISNTDKYNKPNDYTPDSFAVFKEAYDAAVTVNDAQEITRDRQGEVDALQEALEDSAAALAYAPYDYTKIYTAIEAFEALNKDDYTPDSYAAVKAVIAAVPEGLTKAPIDVEKGANALKAINNAVKNLVKAGPADYKAVNDALAAAAALNSEDYTAESWAAVEKAVGDVNFNLNANHQGEVEAMATAINKAIAALVKKFDPAEHQAAKIAEIKEIENIPDKNKETKAYKDLIAYYETQINNAETKEEMDSLAAEAIKYLNDFIPETHTVTANNGATVTQTFDPEKSTKYQVATVKIAEDDGIKDGNRFVYWTDENGIIVSTYSTYSFFVVKDIELTPVYVSLDDYYTERAKGVLVNNIVRSETNANGTVTLFTEHSVSKAAVGNAIGQHGIIYTTDLASVPDLKIGSDNELVNVIFAQTTNTALTGMLRTTVNPKNADKIYAVTFITDAEGNTTYSEMKEIEVSVISTDSPVVGTLEATLTQAEEYIYKAVQKYFDDYKAEKIADIEKYIEGNVPADLASSDNFKSQIAAYKKSIEEADTTKKIDKIFDNATSYINEAVENYISEYKKDAISTIDKYIAENVPVATQNSNTFKNVVAQLKKAVNDAPDKSGALEKVGVAIQTIDDEYIPEIYNVTVNGGAKVTKSLDVTKSFKYEVATVSIKEADGIKDGKWFVYWVDANGNIVSTYSTYSFFAVRDIELTPVYVSPDSYETERAKGIVVTDIVRADDNGDGTATLFTDRSVSKASVGNSIRQHGVIYTTNVAYGNETDLVLNSGLADVKTNTATSTALTGIFRTTINADGAEKIYARSYVVDTKGNVTYGEVKEIDVSTGGAASSSASTSTIETTLVQAKEIVLNNEPEPEPEPEPTPSIIDLAISFIRFSIELIKAIIGLFKQINI